MHPRDSAASWAFSLFALAAEPQPCLSSKLADTAPFVGSRVASSCSREPVRSGPFSSIAHTILTCWEAVVVRRSTLQSRSTMRRIQKKSGQTFISVGQRGAIHKQRIQAPSAAKADTGCSALRGLPNQCHNPSRNGEPQQSTLWTVSRVDGRRALTHLGHRLGRETDTHTS